MVQADAGEQLPGPHAVRPPPGESHGHEDIFQGGEAAEQVEGLEDVADPLRPKAVALGLGKQGDVPIVDADLAAVGAADAGDHVQQGGLAAAAAADQHHLLAGVHVKLGDIEDRQRRAVGLDKRLLHVEEVEHERSYAKRGRMVRAGSVQEKYRHRGERVSLRNRKRTASPGPWPPASTPFLTSAAGWSAGPRPSSWPGACRAVACRGTRP